MDKIEAFLLAMNLSFVLLAAVLSTALSAAASLQDGSDIKSEIVAPAQQSYSLALREGQLAVITLDKEGVNSSLALDGANGSIVAVSDLHDMWTETIAYVSPATAEYIVKIKTAAVSLSGNYRLRCRIISNITSQDRLLIDANKLSQEGANLIRTASSDHSQAGITKLQEAAELWKRIGNRQEFSYCLIFEATGARYLGQDKRAISLSEEAFQNFTALGNQYGASAALRQKGIAASLSGDRKAAVEIFRRNLDLVRRTRNDAGLAIAYADLGATLVSLGVDGVEAQRVLREAAVLSRRIDAKVTEAAALSNLAQYENNVATYRQASEDGERATAILHDLHRKREEGVALITAGEAQEKLGELQPALAKYQQSLQIRRELNSKEGIAFSLQAIGRIFIDEGRFEEAITQLKAAEAELLQTDNRVNFSALLSSEATALRGMGRYDEALETLQRALQSARDAKFSGGEATTLAEIGRLFYELDNQERSIEFTQRALTAFQNTVENEKFVVLDTLARLYAQRGEPVKTASSWSQLLELAQTAGSRAYEADALIGLGQTYLIQRKPDLAERMLQDALSKASTAQDSPAQAAALLALSELHTQAGDWQAARKCSTEAISLLTASQDKPKLCKALAQSAELELLAGNLELAEQRIQSSLKLSESLRAQIYNPVSRLTWFSSAQEANRIQVRILMALHERRPDQHFDVAAFQAVEQMRARSLLDPLPQNASSKSYSKEEAPLLDQKRKIAERLAALEVQRTKLLINGRTAEAAELEPDITELHAQFEQLEGSSITKSPTSSSPVFQLAQLQSSLGPSRVLLEYSLDTARSYVFVIGTGIFRSVSIVGEATIRRLVDQLSRVVVSRAPPDRQFTTLAAELSGDLFGPVLPDLQRKELAIIADGALNQLPFALLPLDLASGGGSKQYRPLILDHQVTMVPSASYVLERQSKWNGSPQFTKAIAVFADPVFTTQDPRFHAEPKAGPGDDRSASGDEGRLLEHLEDTSNGVPLATKTLRLKYTLQEARRIAALAPSGAVLEELGFNATVKNALTVDLSQYRYVHFATHGWLDPEHPERSALVLSMVDREQRPLDGLLSTWKVEQLKLHSDVVTLSACQTGLGLPVPGEGIVGLTQAFLNAGSAHVIVSYWSVNDQATAILMADLYKGMLRRKLTPAEALRDAQIKMIRDKKWNAPYFWAAFSVHGGW